MDFLLFILKKIEFISYKDQVIIKIRDNFFSDYEKFLKLNDFICIFIKKNPVCFVTKIFPVNQRIEHYNHLKIITNLYFQTNY